MVEQLEGSYALLVTTHHFAVDEAGPDLEVDHHRSRCRPDEGAQTPSKLKPDYRSGGSQNDGQSA
jgi:hypothetical protein